MLREPEVKEVGWAEDMLEISESYDFIHVSKGRCTAWPDWSST